MAAAPPPLLALARAGVTFGGGFVFDNVDLAIAPGDRVCLIGRNGSGKSTLLRVLSGVAELDRGARHAAPGLAVGVLPQEPPRIPGESVAQHVGAAPQAPAEHEVAAILDRLRLAPGRAMTELSGGEARRASLARALVGSPDLLLLDEPTNHLDLPTVLWLEETLRTFGRTFGRRTGRAGGQALVVVSHDRAFLRAISNRMAWLREGRLRTRAAGYAAFEDWADQIAEEEAAAARKLDQRLKAGRRWMEHGITARRRRNQGRLRKLGEMRQARRAMLKGGARVTMSPDTGAAVSTSGRLVIEAEAITKRYGEACVIDRFSTRIMRGERIGLIGPNGAGKTTLLRLLTGRLAPDGGQVRLGANLELAWFEQARESLNPAHTPWQVLAPGGGDSLMVHGRQRHVVAYLRDFLFDERQVTQPIATLSGGEQSRLLLARILARPSNLMVLDEPTNDLDADTLDVLQEMLDAYEGTLLIVSHDRDFLDHTVTGIIAVEGGGRVEEFAGGYSDVEAHWRPAAPPVARARARRSTPRPTPRPAKLGYRETGELGALPARIAELERAKAQLESILADPGLYVRDQTRFTQATARLVEVSAALDAAETRWLELEERCAARSGGQ